MIDWKEAARWYRARFRSAMRTIDQRTQLASAERQRRMKLIAAMADIMMDIAYDDDDPDQTYCNICRRHLIEENGHATGCLHIVALTTLIGAGRLID